MLGGIAQAPAGTAQLAGHDRAGATWDVGAAAVLLTVELTELREAGDAGVFGDAGVSAAEQDPARAEGYFFELATGLEVTFRAEIFTDFAALLHAARVRPIAGGGPTFLKAAA
jgi:hypothetical protein